MSRAAGYKKFTAMTHLKPNLCPYCHYLKAGLFEVKGEGFPGYVCEARRTILDNPQSEKCRCRDFRADGGMHMTLAQIDELIDKARGFKAARKQFAAGGRR